MALRFGATLTVAILALGAAGCSMMPWGDDEPQTSSIEPRPLPPAPTAPVTAAPLPPPAAPTLAAPATPPGAVPPASGARCARSCAGGSGRIACARRHDHRPRRACCARSGSPPAAVANVEVGRTDLLGGWTIAAAGDSCQLFMTLTTWSGGYRASTKGCSNDALKNISAWNMEGRQVQLLNDSGATVARLYPATKTQFNGQTEGGGPVSVSRT